MRKAKGLLGGLGSAAKGVALGGLMAGAAGATAALGGLAVTMRGVKKALDLGGQLSDLSAQTGIAVGELAVLQQAFEDNGLSAAKVGPTINKMQKSISDAGNGLTGPLRALKAMGVTMDELAGKSPEEQFAIIQESLAGMEDATMRAGAAMDIFGRSGGELQALFQDSGAMDKARETLGGQSEILERNAASFDRASDLFKSMTKKLQGFFVGIADYVTPVLLPVLEKLNKLDLSKYGQAAGRFVAVIAEGFREGRLTGMLKDGLMIAAKEFVNALVNGMKGVVAFLAAALPPIVESAWAKMRDPMFWRGVMEGFKGMAYAFEEIVQRALGRNDKAELARAWKEGSLRFARKAIDHAGDGKAVADTMREALSAGAAAFGREMEENGPLGTEAERGRLAGTMDALRSAVDAKREQEEADETAPAEAPDNGLLGGGSGGRSGLRPLVTSLGRVGGASLLGGVAGLDRERNGLLKRIERNTRDQAPKVAVFA